MYLDYGRRQTIAEELLYDLGGRLDGSKKNILVRRCPLCGHDGNKFGIYVGPDTSSKQFGASNCFHCGRGAKTLEGTLRLLGKIDLIPEETVILDDSLDFSSSLFDDEIDDTLSDATMPVGYKRCYKHPYLKSRGWVVDDYQYFPVGTNRAFERDYENYVILEIRDGGRTVGFVGRSTMSKDEIDAYNEHHRFSILRYRNSNEKNGTAFSKLIYNIDAIEPGITKSVIVCEGAFDVVSLNRKLDLYDNKYIVPIATFGKKMSHEQIYKLQSRGITQVVLGYDNDAKETVRDMSMDLERYFDVLIANIPEGIGKDWDEMDVEDIYDIFCDGLMTVREFNLI